MIEIIVTLIPPASGSLDIGQRMKDSAIVRQKRACLLKVTHGGIVILQTRIVIIALGEHCLAQIGLKSDRSFGCLPCFFTKGVRRLKIHGVVTDRIGVGEERPSESKTWIQL